MHDFLVDPLRLGPDDTDVIIVARRAQSDPRRTARHSHARGQLLGTTRGVVSVGSDRGRWLIPPINALWLPPYIEHDFASHGAFNGWSVYVSEEACGNLSRSPKVIRLSGLLQEAVLRASCWEPGPFSAHQRNIAAVILDEIYLGQDENLSLPMPADIRLRAVAQTIADDPGQTQHMAYWATHANMAPRTFTRRFSFETGLSFSEWRQRARLLRSLEMLAVGTPVTTVAFDLGYSTVSAFIEMFRGYFGVTPGRYLKSP